MKSTFVKGVVVGAVVSAITLAASAAVAGTGVGGVLNLGKYNGVNATTALAGSTAGKQLSVVNASGASGATGIAIAVHSGKPPLTVNSSTQVPNLNASYVGGKKASTFAQGTITQSGLITIAGGNEVFLGEVHNMGGLWGECENANAAASSVVLKTNNALPSYFFITSDGNSTLANGGATLQLTGNTVGKLATGQISSGSHTATITASAFDSIAGGCSFSAQSTSSG